MANAAGYMIGYTSQSGPLTNFIDVGNVTSFNLTGLDNTKSYTVAIYALGLMGNSASFINGPVGRIVLQPLP